MTSKTEKLEKYYDKLAFFDVFTILFVVFNILDTASTAIGISSGKGEETNIILIEILDSYGIVVLTILKICLSVALLVPLLIKHSSKANIYTKSVTTGIGIVSISLLPLYIGIVLHNISILL